MRIALAGKIRPLILREGIVTRRAATRESREAGSGRLGERQRIEPGLRSRRAKHYKIVFKINERQLLMSLGKSTDSSR